MRDVVIAGIGMTDLRERDKSLIEMASESSLQAISDAGAEDEEFDAIYFANMASGAFASQTAVASALADRISLVPAGAHRIENGPASGGSAIRSALMGIASGMQDLVLVTGSEKMSDVSGDVATDILASMNHPEAEYKHGVPMPGMGALFTRLYMEKYGVTEDHLAVASAKNHSNGTKNPKAQLRHKPAKMEGIKDSIMVADPIRLYHTCPITDGSAALVMCSKDKAEELGANYIKVVGSGQATDAQAVEEREDPLRLKSVKIAADEAFGMAELDRDDVDVIETHDAFITLELAQIEAAGFFEPGEAGEATLEGKTKIDGELPVNPSGGLKARGHPVGATGIAQAFEIVTQLREEAGERQVKGAKIGYCCNFGGFGNNTVIHLLRRP
ncbi:MAG: acetyl-CoA acetyltransferase [Hadesarchaea archaeon]|nr:acetyl-CoA acetyltransferase [Hadesarchaea archaeon]